MNSPINELRNVKELCKELDPRLRVSLLEATMTPFGLEMKINVDLFQDPATWGIFMADLAHHASSAYEDAHRLPREQTLRQILEIFEAEVASPASEAKDHLHRPN